MSERVTRPSRVWIASTDADSRGIARLLTTMAGFADDKVDLVLGTVLPDDLPTAALNRWLQRHLSTPSVHPMARSHLRRAGASVLSAAGPPALLPNSAGSERHDVSTVDVPTSVGSRIEEMRLRVSDDQCQKWYEETLRRRCETASALLFGWKGEFASFDDIVGDVDELAVCVLAGDA